MFFFFPLLMTDFSLVTILRHFKIEGTIEKIKPLGKGLINTSYVVKTLEDDKPDYVLQSINNHVFQNINLLQKNILLVTSHITKKLIERGETDLHRKVLKFVESDANDLCYYFDGKNYWRVYIFIGDSITNEQVTPESSYAAGKMFGDFQYLLSDIPEQLGETIPNFHNMEFRLNQLRESIKENKAGRLDEVQYYIDEIEKRAEEMCKAERLFRENKLPKRISHCDTKVDNMLFDKDGKPLCVIDLDTVMPSFIFSDYGDFLRTAANTGLEDDPNLENVGFNFDIFKAFTKGYLESAKAFLTQIEIENMPYAVKLFPYMQCVRFLTDYINGDTYYQIKYPTHNLVRTKAQFKLLTSVEENVPKMEEFIRDCLN
ncbi:putative desulfatase [Tritrichomonas foetus]|uniref:Desulfatase n=1 Tax=Tritrichomonas foetus TaxID=1144522 RepID=A0A1J4L684_9EUKA|nr:putative desulfatase [Tritrichomonas foetus]|eukprot:OHT17524.1 putative desulfatase [Tritrichomonas foetus]